MWTAVSFRKVPTLFHHQQESVGRRSVCSERTMSVWKPCDDCSCRALGFEDLGSNPGPCTDQANALSLSFFTSPQPSEKNAHTQIIIITSKLLPGRSFQCEYHTATQISLIPLTLIFFPCIETILSHSPLPTSTPCERQKEQSDPRKKLAERPRCAWNRFQMCAVGQLKMYSWSELEGLRTDVLNVSGLTCTRHCTWPCHPLHYDNISFITCLAPESETVLGQAALM